MYKRQGNYKAGIWNAVPWSGAGLAVHTGEAVSYTHLDVYKRQISTKLTIHQGNVTHAAQDAGLPRSYFHEIMRRYTKDEK